MIVASYFKHNDAITVTSRVSVLSAESSGSFYALRSVCGSSTRCRWYKWHSHYDVMGLNAVSTVCIFFSLSWKSVWPITNSLSTEHNTTKWTRRLLFSYNQTLCQQNTAQNNELNVCLPDHAFAVNRTQQNELDVCFPNHALAVNRTQQKELNVCFPDHALAINRTQQNEPNVCFPDHALAINRTQQKELNVCFPDHALAINRTRHNKMS